uniref:T9SS type B sorting domain-containing protein n=1 Tax=Flavobacterium sp. TaxID=239 RepID=UPI0025C18D58
PDGVYSLVSIRDNTSAGEVVCTPVEIKSNSAMATAKLVKYGDTLCSGAGSGIQVQITSSASGPFTIEYEIDGILQSPVTLNNTGLHTLVTTPAKEGTYRLTKISTAGCASTLDDTLVIDKGTPTSASAKLIKYGGVSCSGLGSGIQVNVTSTKSGPFIIEYEMNGIAQSPVTISSTGLHTFVTAPAKEGTYRLTKISVGACSFSLDETLVIYGGVPPKASARLIKYGGNSCLGENPGVQVEITSPDPGPFKIEYEINGILQSPVTINNAGLYTLIAAPSKAGSYRIVKISTGGCDFSLDHTLVITDDGPFTASAKLAQYGDNLCSGTGSGVQVQITSSNSGPFTIAYELDGIVQSPVTVNNAGLHTLITAPAKTGTYRLTKITVGDCDFSLDDTLVISAGVPPKASARLIKYGGNSCLGENSGAQVEITSSVSGPFIIEYEFNGIVQSPVTINNAGLHTLIAAPAMAGTYRIIKMSTGGCNFSLDDTLVINKEEPFTATAKLFKYGENFCLGENSGVQVEITSIDPGPFTIDYTVNGIAQSPVTINSAGLHTLVETPAKTGTYRLTKISTRSCSLLMDDFLVIDENTVSDEVTIEGKLRICKGESATLRVNIRSNQEIVSYQWKVNGNDIFGADTNTYVATQEGNYTVSVSTSKGCYLLSAVAKVIFLSNEDCELEKQGLDYPKFFTPNGDGYNDTWHVINLENVNYVEIDIFDRYGKFITHLTENSPGWDGTYKNNPVLASDYWFVLTYEEMNNPGIKKQIRSHFSLKR